MRLFAFAFALLVSAAPAVAGPLDTLQYRATVRIDRPSVTGPTVGYGDAVAAFGAAPSFGVVARGTPEWLDTYPAYPSAGFALLYAGALRTYIASDAPPFASGSAPFQFDFELRDADGHTGTASFASTVDVNWSDGNGYTSLFPFGFPSPQPILLGDTRYDVQLSYESALIYYQSLDDKLYLPSRLWIPQTPYPDGDYTNQFGGIIYATVTAAPEPAVGTPEPGTLALAAIGLVGVGAARRLRRTAV